MSDNVSPILTTGEQYLGLNTTTYEFDYFSGSQIAVYIGSVWVDDIYDIQFSVTQSKRPVYGYASQYWHTVGSGQVLVEGSFSVPFREAALVPMVLTEYNRQMVNDSDPSPIKGYGKTKDDKPDKKKLEVFKEGIRRRVAYNSKNASPPGGIVLNQFEDYAGFQALDDQDFEGVAEAFQDVLWQNSQNPQNDAGYDLPNLHPGQVSGTLDNSIRRADQYPEFDIWILYGDVANKATNTTFKKIIRAHIIGQGQQIAVGGEPILERYSFFARNLV